MATNSARTRRLLHEMALEEAAIMARIKEARELAGLTQSALADLLQVHINTVANWERQHMPTMRDLPRLAAALNKTPDWLLYGEDAPAEGLTERLDRMEQMLTEVLHRLPREAASQ